MAFPLRLIVRYPLETTSALGLTLWLAYFVAPWNPWEVSVGTARAMDATGIPRGGWIAWVALAVGLKWYGVLSGHYWPRAIGAAAGFSFWIFLTVVVVRASPTSILAVPFVTAAIGSAVIFLGLQYERGQELRSRRRQKEELDAATRRAAA